MSENQTKDTETSGDADTDDIKSLNENVAAFRKAVVGGSGETDMSCRIYCGEYDGNKCIKYCQGYS